MNSITLKFIMIVEPAHTPINYQILFDSVPDCYLILTKTFTIVEVSNAYLKASQTNREEILGRGIFQVFPDNPDDPEATGVRNLKASLLRVLANLREDTMPVQKYDIPTREGNGFEERYWSPLNTPILDEKGDIIYIIHRVEDVTDFIKLKQQGHKQVKENEALRTITERMEAEVYVRAQQISETNNKLKQANKTLAEMYDKSKELDRLKMNFFANINHELRTPLTLILGPIVKLLNSTSFSEEEHNNLEIIERNAQLLLKHVNDLLDIAKLESKEMVTEYANVNLARLTVQLASNFEFFAKEKKIDFTVNIPSSLHADVDESKLQRVLLNLLSNALKFTPAGGKVDLQVQKTGNKAIFTVCDTGPGIPISMREIIFERFRQIDESSRRHKGGTGLGLAIVKEFVTLHKGNIKVVDSAKGGAKFIVTLPIKAPIGFTVAKDPKANDTKIDKLFVTEFGNYDTTRTKAILPHPHTKHKELILVVEDNYDMNTFLTQILSSLNYRVETAYNGKEGLEKALRQLPDLIISDVMMPEMNGEEMALTLLAHPETKNIPLLMLTAKMDNALKIGLLKEGVQDYINKPFSTEELCVKVERLITQRRKRIAEHEGLIQQLSISNQELERFAYAAAHDLKSPLRVIDNLSQWIEEDLAGLVRGTTKEYMEKLRNQVHFMEKLLDDVLEYSRIDYKLEQNNQIINSNQLIDNIIALIDPPKEFLVKIVDKFKPLYIQLVPLQQALYNLIHNAIKHHDKEVGTIEVSIEENETKYIFNVRDDGPGIAQEYHQNIFNMFQTLKPHLPTGGTGMGLALVKKIVTNYGGEITVTSELGHGSLFQFTWNKLIDPNEQSYVN